MTEDYAKNVPDPPVPDLRFPFQDDTAADATPARPPTSADARRRLVEEAIRRERDDRRRGRKAEEFPLFTGTLPPQTEAAGAAYLINKSNVLMAKVQQITADREAATLEDRVMAAEVQHLLANHVMHPNVTYVVGGKGVTLVPGPHNEYGVQVMVFPVETLPDRTGPAKTRDNGYGTQVQDDRPF